jgi:hypothetical protein
MGSYGEAPARSLTRTLEQTGLGLQGIDLVAVP